ncbi:MAG: thioredoxin family protein [Archaeoglobus sp.]|uniref:thioredoxin family protein n=1 Tax=Archaeoglobus sp. TaxID=1872626 RepID=UPI001DD494ED|nr:thioredoxin family protein [Archaeoglobus sp.]MBO8180093.1 thioredoxin family protein [Archaeoglobus sp.]
MKAAYVLIAVVAIALIAISTFSQSDSLEGWYSYEEGKKLSEEQDKKMFVFIGTPECPVCKKFKEFFRENESAMEFIRENYIPVYVDATREKPPVVVFQVPVFCTGFDDNLSCFSTAFPEELMQVLEK